MRTPRKSPIPPTTPGKGKQSVMFRGDAAVDRLAGRKRASARSTSKRQENSPPPPSNYNPFYPGAAQNQNQNQSFESSAEDVLSSEKRPFSPCPGRPSLGISFSDAWEETESTVPFPLEAPESEAFASPRVVDHGSPTWLSSALQKSCTLRRGAYDFPKNRLSRT